LEFASQDDRALLTLNRKHFIRLHNSSIEHSGIVVCRVDVDFERLAIRIDSQLRSEPDLNGKLLRVNRPC
jgi:hypothetical protein